MRAGGLPRDSEIHAKDWALTSIFYEAADLTSCW